MGKKDKEFAEKFGLIMSHFIRGMIARYEFIDESLVLLEECIDEMSSYSSGMARNIIMAIAKEEV
jgi:hypothetical protein